MIGASRGGSYFAQLADVMQDRPCRDQVGPQRRQLGVFAGILVCEPYGIACHGQRVLEPAADIRVMVSPRGRPDEQFLVMPVEQRQRQVEQRPLGYFLSRNSGKLSEHQRRIEARTALTHVWIEAFG